MPFTPFHMGPGLLVKAACGRHLSLVVFGISQIAIDVEPLVRILRGDEVLHGFTHTLVGAILIGLASALAGRPLARLLLGAWTPAADARFERWLRGSGRPTWTAALAGGLVGTTSHVALDALMHADMRPLAPWSDRNPLLGLVPTGELHVACVSSAALGVAVLAVAYLLAHGSRADRSR